MSVVTASAKKPTHIVGLSVAVVAASSEDAMMVASAIYHQFGNEFSMVDGVKWLDPTMTVQQLVRAAA